MTRPSRPASSARPLQGRGVHAWAERQRRFLRSLAVRQPLLARLAPRFVARVFGVVSASGPGVGFVPPVNPTRPGAARRAFVPALAVLSTGRSQLHRITERSHPATPPEASPELIPTPLPAAVDEASDEFGSEVIEGLPSLEVPSVEDARTEPVALSPYGEEAVPGEVPFGDLESLEEAILEGAALDEPERDVSDSGFDAVPNEAEDARGASTEDRANTGADTLETALPPSLVESGLDHDPEDAARLPEDPPRPSKRKSQRAPEVSVRGEPGLPSIQPIEVDLQEPNLEPVKARRGRKSPSATQDSSQPQVRQVLETQQITRAIEAQPVSEIELRPDERASLEAPPPVTEIPEAGASGFERSTPLEIAPAGAPEPTALRGSDATEPAPSEDRADSLAYRTEGGLESPDLSPQPSMTDAPPARALEAKPEGDPTPRPFEPTETSPERAPETISSHAERGERGRGARQPTSERPTDRVAPVGDEPERRIKTRNIVPDDVPSESERSVDARALLRDPEVRPGSELTVRPFEAEREPGSPPGVQATSIGAEGEPRALEGLSDMGQSPVTARTPLEAPPETERTASGPAENAAESLEVPEAAPVRSGSTKGNPLEPPPQERELVPAIPPPPTPVSDGAPLAENRVVETVKPRRPRPVPLAANEVRKDAQAPEPSALEAMTQDTDAIERLFRAWRKPEDRFAPSPDAQAATRFVRPAEVPEPLETRRTTPTPFERAPDEPSERADGSAPDEIAARDSDRRELPDDPLLDVLFRVWARPEDRYSPPSTNVGRETTSRLPRPEVAAGLEQRAAPMAPPRPPLEPQRPDEAGGERRRFQAALQVNPQDGFIAESQIKGLETTPLPESARRFLHPIVGIDPTEARVQRGPLADAIADSRDADAVTLGRDVFVSSAHPDGDPETLALLAHELTHVARGLSPRFVPPIIRDSEASESDQDGSRTASPRPSNAEEDLAERVEARALERAEDRLETGMTALDGSGEFPEFGTTVSNARNTVQDGFEGNSRGPRPQRRESPSDPWNGLPAPWEPMPDLDFSGSSRAFSSGLELASSGAEGLTGGAGAQAASRGRNLERRAETNRQEEVAEDEQGGVQQDLDGLARQVYAILKRRLEMERRRGF